MCDRDLEKFAREEGKASTATGGGRRASEALCEAEAEAAAEGYEGLACGFCFLCLTPSVLLVTLNCPVVSRIHKKEAL